MVADLEPRGTADRPVAGALHEIRRQGFRNSAMAAATPVPPIAPEILNDFAGGLAGTPLADALRG